MIDNSMLRGENRRNCKDKIIRATTIEYTGDRKGKVSFKVEVLYREGRYEEYIFGNVLFNVNVRYVLLVTIVIGTADPEIRCNLYPENEPFCEQGNLGSRAGVS